MHLYEDHFIFYMHVCHAFKVFNSFWRGIAFKLVMQLQKTSVFKAMKGCQYYMCLYIYKVLVVRTSIITLTFYSWPWHLTLKCGTSKVKKKNMHTLICHVRIIFAKWIYFFILVSYSNNQYQYIIFFVICCIKPADMRYKFLKNYKIITVW